MVVEQDCPFCGALGFIYISGPINSNSSYEECKHCHGDGVIKVNKSKNTIPQNPSTVHGPDC